MRREFVFGVLLALIAAATPVVAAIFSPDDMTHLWKFDEGTGTEAADSVGATDGTIDGATWSSGRLGGALYFDGDNDIVDLGSDTSLQVGGDGESFSIEAWVRRASSDTWDVIISHGGSGTREYRNLHFGYHEDGAFVFNFFYEDLYTLSTYTDVGEWHHWVGTYDGSTNAKKLYRDGVLVAQVSADNDYLGTAGQMVVGAQIWDGYTDDYFHGDIDEVALYSRALTADEVFLRYVTTLVEALGEQLLALDLHQGTQKSLAAKLKTASKKFDQANYVAAINVLEAFINAVEAQSGNKIDEDDADSLIATAEAIIEALEGA